MKMVDCANITFAANLDIPVFMKEPARCQSSSVIKLRCAVQMRVSAAGRTDKGVSAHGQVISFYSWQDLAPDDIVACINAASPANLRAWHAKPTPRSFHATWQVVSF